LNSESINKQQTGKTNMRYMMIVKLTGNSETGRNYDAGKPPAPELVAALGKLNEEMPGALLDNGELLPAAKGARIKAAGGKLTVTDGPFTESKEVIGGYAILRAKSKAEALRMGENYMKLHVNILGPSFEAELEIREMADLSGRGPGGAKS
jgi:hypothetical protein